MAIDQLDHLVSINRVADILDIPPDRLRDLATKTDGLYRPYIKRYLSAGKTKERRICIPSDELKFVQRRLNRRILAQKALPEELNGGVPGKTLFINALPHVRQPEVVKVDLEKYFDSITNDHVAFMWRSMFGTGAETTWVLTSLTTFERHIPQGAPTSTAIANLVFTPIVVEIRSALEPLGLKMSSWVDDITASGEGARRAIDLISRKVSRHGLSLSREKTKIMPAWVRQVVPGGVVNSEVSNGRLRLKKARKLIRAAARTRSPMDIARATGSIVQAGILSPPQRDRLEAFQEAIHRRRLWPLS
jgi:RNA-directed DNA polymerase